jgi:hypothetical protein
MPTQTMDALGDRVERLAEALGAQNRTLGMMLGAQRLHNEMLAKVLEAVTKEGDGELGELLGKLAKDGEETLKVVLEIHERVYLE